MKYGSKTRQNASECVMQDFASRKKQIVYFFLKEYIRTSDANWHLEMVAKTTKYWRFQISLENFSHFATPSILKVELYVICAEFYLYLLQNTRKKCLEWLDHFILYAFFFRYVA